MAHIVLDKLCPGRYVHSDPADGPAPVVRRRGGMSFGCLPGGEADVVSDPQGPLRWDPVPGGRLNRGLALYWAVRPSKGTRGAGGLVGTVRQAERRPADWQDASRDGARRGAV